MGVEAEASHTGKVVLTLCIYMTNGQRQGFSSIQHVTRTVLAVV